MRLSKRFRKSEYEELMYVRDKDKDMRFFINEKAGKIRELTWSQGSNEFMLSIFGKIDLKQFQKSEQDGDKMA